MKRALLLDTLNGDGITLATAFQPSIQDLFAFLQVRLVANEFPNVTVPAGTVLVEATVSDAVAVQAAAHPKFTGKFINYIAPGGDLAPLAALAGVSVKAGKP